ncbi:clarin-3 isoform X1 [Oryzias latipes]|nr:clarin-3 isoform X1 [Oryzias latipes]
MPSSKKILYFISSAVSTAVSVGLLGFGMSQEWSTTTVLCARDGTDEFNGTAAVTMGLFNGSLFRDNCPGFQTEASFSAFDKLLETGGAPPALHFLSVILLALCLLFSAGSILLSLYNSVSNPYQTCMGYVGVYACSSLSACLSVLVLILFVINVSVTNLAEVVVFTFVSEVELGKKSVEMKVGYYLVIPYTVLSLVAIGLIYFYEHAAYTHKQEQEKPTEDAPMETMMY